MLRGYADFMAAGTSYAPAKKLNAGALQETENLKLPHPHLAVDVVDQTLYIEQAHVSSLEPKTSQQINFLSWNMEQWLGHIRHREYHTEVHMPFISLAAGEVPAFTQLGTYKENAVSCIISECVSPVSNLAISVINQFP
jgi:hypothetical protein